MMNRKLSMKTVWIAGLLMLGTLALGQTAGDIRIYLSGEKTVASHVFNLGQIAVVLGDDTLVQSINNIPLGKFVTTGQKISVDRNTILSRIASAGFNTNSVTFNGSETISVCRDEKCIGADRFLKTAREFLNKQLKGQEIYSLKLTRSPKDFPLSGDCSDIVLVPQVLSRQSGATHRITVLVMQGGVELNRQEVVFSIQYKCRRLVAKEELIAGTVISKSNTQIQEYGSAALSKDSQRLLYGMVVKRDIRPDTVVSESLLEPDSGPLLIKQRQQVLMKLDTGGLFITAPGIAMQDGRAGEVIRVQRGSRKERDERVVFGKVMPDGTVEPLL